MMHTTRNKAPRGLNAMMRKSSKFVFSGSIISMIVLSVVVGVGGTSVENPGFGQTIVQYIQNLMSGSLLSSKDQKSTHVAVENKTIQKAMMFGSIGEDQVYYIDMMVGTPPRRQSVALSTQGSLLTIPCKQGMGHMDKFFNDDMSSSSKRVGCNDNNCYGKCDKQNMCHFSQKYAEGSEVSGVFISDMIALGEVSEKNQPIRYDHIGCRTDESGIISQQKADGVMGLNFDRNSMPSVLDNLFDKSSVNTRVFSTCMSENGGMLTVGGYDTAYHRTDIESNDIKWLPYNGEAEKNVGLMLKAISVADIRTPLSVETVTSAIVASGSTFTYFPKSAFTYVLKTLEKNCKLSEGCSPKKNMCFSTTYPTKLDLYFPNLKIEFENDIQVDFYPRSYMFRTAGDEVCLGIRPSNEEADERVVLGLTFFKEKQLIFDIERGMIGIVEAKCPEFIRRPKGPDAWKSQESVTDAEYKQLLSSLDSDVMHAASGMESCKSRDYFNRNLPECQRHLEQLEMRMTQCDEPMYFESNPVMCKFVRFVMQTYQGVCIKMPRIDQDFCARVHYFTEELESKCVDRFYQRHRQTCEDNVHYFDIMQVRKCEVQEYYTGHTDLCDNLCEIIDRETEKCSCPEYFRRHVQACEFQHSFDKEIDDNCQRRSYEVQEPLCKRVKMCRKLRQKKCDRESFKATHDRFCERKLPTDVVMKDNSSIVMPQILRDITREVESAYQQMRKGVRGAMNRGGAYEIDTKTGKIVPMSKDDLGRVGIQISSANDQNVNRMSHVKQEASQMDRELPLSAVTDKTNTSGMEVTGKNSMSDNENKADRMRKVIDELSKYDEVSSTMNGDNQMMKEMRNMNNGQMSSMSKGDQMGKSLDNMTNYSQLLNTMSENQMMQKSMDNMTHADRMTEKDQMKSMDSIPTYGEIMSRMNQTSQMMKEMRNASNGQMGKMGTDDQMMKSVDKKTSYNQLLNTMSENQMMQKTMDNMTDANRMMENYQLNSMDSMPKYGEKKSSMKKDSQMMKEMRNMSDGQMDKGDQMMKSADKMTNYNQLLNTMSQNQMMQKSMDNMIRSKRMMETDKMNSVDSMPQYGAMMSGMDQSKQMMEGMNGMADMMDANRMIIEGVDKYMTNRNHNSIVAKAYNQDMSTMQRPRRDLHDFGY